MVQLYPEFLEPIAAIDNKGLKEEIPKELRNFQF